MIGKISNRARKNIEDQDYEEHQKIIARLKSLQENPFKGEVKKVKGKQNIFREKIDDNRLYFRIIPESRTIDILMYDYRGRIKKKTVQRMR